MCNKCLTYKQFPYEWFVLFISGLECQIKSTIGIPKYFFIGKFCLKLSTIQNVDVFLWTILLPTSGIDMSGSAVSESGSMTSPGWFKIETERGTIVKL